MLMALGVGVGMFAFGLDQALMVNVRLDGNDVVFRHLGRLR